MSKRISDVTREVKQNAEKTIDQLAQSTEPVIAAAKQELHNAEQQAAPAVEKTRAAVSDAYAQAKKKAGPALKKAQKEAEPVVKKVKEVAKKAEPTVKAAQKMSKELGSALVPEVYVQMGEKEFTCTDIAARCRADFKASHKGTVRSCKIYIKPEDGMAYYVINQIEGKIQL